MTTLRISTPPGFDLDLVVRSHGWYTLAPFRWDSEARHLSTALRAAAGCEGAVAMTIRDAPSGGLLLDLAPDPGGRGREAARAAARAMLGLDQDLEPFHALCREDPELAWAARRGAGRLLRSPTIWEDLVKVLCTTNCSWHLTRTMVEGLVRGAGPSGPGGRRAFPSPSDLAGRPEDWYRETARAGYRAPYLVELVERVVQADLDPESWRDENACMREVEEAVRSIRGVGDYAAEQILRLLGRCEGLALDSWCRAAYAERYHGGRRVGDRTIERRYRSFGEWAGLALWVDLSRRL